MPVLLQSRTLSLFLVSLSLFASCSRCKEVLPAKSVASIEGIVIRVIDGDTVTLLDSANIEHRVRLKGIDAPERTQEYYQVSRDHLAKLVFQKQVRADYQKVDRYCRIVGTLWTGNSDVSLEQVKAGLAWHYKRYEGEQSVSDREAYSLAETDAQKNKRGLWRNANPVPPWSFRREKKVDSEDEPFDEGSPNRAISSPKSSEDSAGVGNQTLNTSSPSPTPNKTFERAHIGESSIPSRLDHPPYDYIRGNRRSKIYHWPGCPNYDDIAPTNRVAFRSSQEAEAAGYRAARNCP